MLPHVAKRYVLESLNQQVKLHDPSLASRGLEFVPQISQLFWDPEARQFKCAVRDTDGTWHVEVNLPHAIGETTRIACGCSQSHSGPCVHTCRQFALVR